MSSPAPWPTMPTPRTRSVSGSMISFVTPSGLSNVSARPEAPHGIFQPKIIAIRRAPNGHEHAIVHFFFFNLIGTFGNDAHFFTLGRHFNDFRFETKLAKIFLRVL